MEDHKGHEKEDKNKEVLEGKDRTKKGEGVNQPARDDDKGDEGDTADRGAGIKRKQEEVDKEKVQLESPTKKQHSSASIASASSSQAESQTPSASLDALGAIAKEYSAIQSQEVQLEMYKRNLEYIEPLGRLSLHRVQEGRAVLDQLKEVLQDEKMDAKKKHQRITDLSNEFYTLIPTQAETKLPAIDSEVLLQDKYTLLRAIEEAQIEQHKEAEHHQEDKKHEKEDPK